MADENKYNIKIECGTDFVLPFVWTDDNGNPIDLTGATVSAQLREYSGDPDAIDFICTHNNAGGRIMLVMPNELTRQITYSYGVYDVTVVLGSGVIKRPLYGEVKVQDEVTKPLDGEMLYTVAIESYNKLPVQGLTNRLYYVYAEQMILRWNGTNYVSALEQMTLHNEGVWDEDIAYQKFATVTNAGSSYMALQNVPEGTDIDDATYWLKLAEAGGAENIDDSAGEGDTTVTWSADKIQGEFNSLGDLAHEDKADEDHIADYMTGKYQRCYFLAHRGYSQFSSFSQDDSAQAIENAFKNGFHGIECDPRKDKDGVIVLLHDSTVDSVSSSTGAISTLSYTAVKYKAKSGRTDIGYLTTLAEAVGIVKNHRGYMLFDMGKYVVTVQEIVDICESSDFYDYGFFNTATEEELANAPDYCLKVWGNNIFVHTEAELDGYLAYGAKNNAVRFTSLTEPSIDLARSKGFKIVFNYVEGTLNGNAAAINFNKIDFALGDLNPVMWAKDDYYQHSVLLEPTISLTDYCNSLPVNTFSCIQIQRGHPDNAFNDNIMCVIFKQGSSNYIEIFAISLYSNNAIYKKVCLSGNWYGWTKLGGGTTKGDILVYKENGITERLPIGTDGQVLTVDSSTTLGVKWATPT